MKISQPKDKNILLKDIIQIWNGDVSDEWIARKLKQKRWGNHFGTVETLKSNTLCAIGKSDVLFLLDKKRYLNPEECEDLQTVPRGYTQNVCETARYKALGNGWTVDVIAHIFRENEKELNSL